MRTKTYKTAFYRTFYRTKTTLKGGLLRCAGEGCSYELNPTARGFRDSLYFGTVKHPALTPMFFIITYSQIYPQGMDNPVDKFVRWLELQILSKLHLCHLYRLLRYMLKAFRNNIARQ